ncbi:MAG: 3-phosphoshikimate 1-carboxyvinyltransferase [Candidatus Pelagibacterales bacterium]
MTIQVKYKLIGSLNISGDKSISHRSVIMGAMSIGQTKIFNLLESKDIFSTINILRNLGVKIRKVGEEWIVNGVGTSGFKQPHKVLDAGNSGTTSRLMLGAVATNPICATFTGDKSLCSRPMSRVTDLLEDIGAKVELTKNNYLPLSIEGTQNSLPKKHVINKPSAQIKSCIMLAALNINGQTSIIENQATRDHTEILFKYLKIKFKKNKYKDGKIKLVINGPVEIAAKKIFVASDPSSAAFFIVGALIIPGSNIKIKNVCLNKTRIAYIKILKRMGGNISVKKIGTLSGESIGNVSVKYSRLKSIEIHRKLAPYLIDEYPILAIAASRANGITKMRGLGELRFKESDRLQSINENLLSCNINSLIIKDDLIIEGSNEMLVGNNKVNTYHDHRIAMAFSILSLICERPLKINSQKCINISYPKFNQDLKSLLRNV